MRRIIKAVLWGALILAPSVTYAQGQPPIQSAQDAACRQEATGGGHVRREGAGPLCARPTDLDSVHEPYEPGRTCAQAGQARQAGSACP